MAEAFAYFADCDNNPMVVATNVKRKQSKKDTGDSREQGNDERTVARPYTLYGLCLWCGIFEDWSLFKANCKRRADAEDFERVIGVCESIVKNQQVSGAMVGVYAERLVARLNGLGDSVTVNDTPKRTWKEVVAMLRCEDDDDETNTDEIS